MHNSLLLFICMLCRRDRRLLINNLNLLKGTQFKPPLSVKLYGQSQIGAGFAPEPVPRFPRHDRQFVVVPVQLEHYVEQT